MTQPALRAVLADDEPKSREILRYYLGRVGGVEVVGEAGDGVEAARLVEELRPDVVFLDVRMPGVDGLEAVRLMQCEGAWRPCIVFVTAFENHAVSAFEAEAVDYVVKPLTVARVWQTVDRLRRRTGVPKAAAVSPPSSPSAAPPRRIPLPVGGAGQVQRTVFLDPASILAVEAQGKTCVLWTRRGKLTVLHSLSALEGVLPASLFFRVHRSYLANLRAVSELFADGRTHGIRLDGCPIQVPVSRDRVSALRAALGALP